MKKMIIMLCASLALIQLSTCTSEMSLEDQENKAARAEFYAVMEYPAAPGATTKFMLNAVHAERIRLFKKMATEAAHEVHEESGLGNKEKIEKVSFSLVSEYYKRSKTSTLSNNFSANKENIKNLLATNLILAMHRVQENTKNQNTPEAK